jgi:hypothetical protein
VNAHRALDRKSGDKTRGGTQQKALCSGYLRVAENNEATAPQIAAQSPNDKSKTTTTIKVAPVSTRRGTRFPKVWAGGHRSSTEKEPCNTILLSTSSPRRLVCADFVNAIAMPHAPRFAVSKKCPRTHSIRMLTRAGGGFGGLGPPKTLPARAHA